MEVGTQREGSDYLGKEFHFRLTLYVGCDTWEYEIVWKIFVGLGA